jgi:hypothetical protein
MGKALPLPSAEKAGKTCSLWGFRARGIGLARRGRGDES